MSRDEPAAPAPSTLRAFAEAMLGLLECRRCFALALARPSGFAVRAVRVGFDDDIPPGSDVVTRLAQWPAWREAALFGIDPADGLAAELLGRGPGEPEHALAGRLPCGDVDLVFVAGWRRQPFLDPEMACATRATSIIWAATQGFAQSPDDLSLDRMVGEMAFPAFAVDHKMQVLEANEAGRQVLSARTPVRLDNGALAGPSPLVSGLMQQALRDAAASRSERIWSNAIIPLSTDHRSFAFAWIGAAPAEWRAERLLVVIPQIEPAAGARRIAAAFGLHWADERIVLRILRGETPAQIGPALELTEATVRTYIKRIMLKLGINRQVEFFLLYILTAPPFADGLKEPSAGEDAVPCRRASGAGHGKG